MATRTRTPARTARPQLTPPVDEERDHIKGPLRLRAPGATLVEYGDFQCPHCGAAHWVLLDIEEQIGDRMRLVFRDFPLTTVHPNAEQAAEAAEAAGAQGKFWEMHDMLFEHQDALEDEDLLEYAAAIGLDLPRFARELGSHADARRVHEDFLSGINSGVNGTPTFFINGRRHDGPWDQEALMTAILDAAASQRG